MSTFSDFLSMLDPFINLCLIILCYPVFGVPLWNVLFSFLIVFFVIGFITKGNVRLSSLSSVFSSRHKESGKASSHGSGSYTSHDDVRSF